MGGLTSDPFRAWAGDCGQTNGRSTRVPGSFAVASTSSAARSTAR